MVGDGQSAGSAQPAGEAGKGEVVVPAVSVGLLRAGVGGGQALRQEETRAVLATRWQRKEVGAATARVEDEVVAAHVGEAGVAAPPVRVFGKVLRDGRLFSLYLIPHRGDPWSYQALALIEGVALAPFGLVVHHHASPVPGLPHVLSIPPATPDTRLGAGDGSLRRALVALTDVEARAIDHAVRAWGCRRGDALRAAVPGAPTWKIARVPVEPDVGEVLWDGHARTHTVILAVSRRWQDEGGAGGGWLYAVTVRAALLREMANSPCHCADPTVPCPSPGSRKEAR